MILTKYCKAIKESLAFKRYKNRIKFKIGSARNMWTLGKTIVSTITVANRSSSDATFRISVSVNGAATATKDYVIYDATCAGNGLQAFTMGFTMDATDKIRIYASSADLSFNVFGSEIA